MSGYVACPACGTRMKSGRGHCLHCFQTLPLDSGPQAPPRWFRSRQTSGRTLIVGVVLTLGALLLSALIWENATPRVNDVARPALSAARVTASAPALAGDAPVGGPVRPSILEPGFVDAPRARNVSSSTGNFAAARSTYEQALRQRPDDPDSLNNLGQVLVRLGKIDEALPHFERAASLAPNKWAYQFNLAHAASQLLLWDRAVAAYRRARALSPTDYATQFDLAMALHKQGEDVAAIPEFEKAIALSPGEPAVYVALAISLEKTDRVPEAVRAYRRFLEMEPGSPDAEKLRAYVEALGSAQQPAKP